LDTVGQMHAVEIPDQKFDISESHGSPLPPSLPAPGEHVCSCRPLLCPSLTPDAGGAITRQARDGVTVHTRRSDVAD
jgi:hypothetical protein